MLYMYIVIQVFYFLSVLVKIYEILRETYKWNCSYNNLYYIKILSISLPWIFLESNLPVNDPRGLQDLCPLQRSTAVIESARIVVPTENRVLIPEYLRQSHLGVPANRNLFSLKKRKVGYARSIA